MGMKSMRYKKILSVLTPIIVVTGIFLLGGNAHAADWAYDLVGNILGVVISALGLVLMLAIQGLIAIASFQDFIKSQAVVLGWTIVRDVCNMFFVVILMIIAFGTILHLENYNYKKWLPKLILMAVLINFSKTICGLLIDVSQVVMLTFVNAFKDIGGGNLTQMLGISDIVTMSKQDSNISLWTVVGAYVLGIIYLLVAIVVIFTMLMMFAMRLVMIWIYVVLSPLAYLLSAFPGGQKYASQWWEEFTKTLIVGPVLAFFIWLSLASLSSSTGITATGNDASQVGFDSNNSSTAASNAATPDALIRYVIGIGMLIGGLKIASSVGGTVGGIAGKGMSKINKGASVAGAFALTKAKSAAKTTAAATSRTALGAASGITQEIGNMTGSSILKNTGKIGLAWRRDMIDTNKKNKVNKRQKFLEKMGFGEKAADATNEYLKTQSGKRLSTAMHGGAAGTMVGSMGGPLGSVIGGAAGTVLGAVTAHLTSPDRWANAAKRADAKAEKYDKKYAEQKQIAEACRLNNDNKGDKKATMKADKFARKAGKARKASEKYNKNDIKRQEKTPENNFYNNVSGFTSETTQKAAAKMSAEVNNARQLVKNAKNDGEAFMDESGPSTFYTNSGGGKRLAQQLTDPNNLDAPEAIKNMTDWVNGAKIDSSKEGKSNDAKMVALAKMIAAMIKGGKDVSALGGLKSALNAKTVDPNDPNYEKKLKNVDDYNSTVTAYRKTGEVGEQGDGDLSLNTFANNTAGEAGKNVIGVDYNKLKASGVDIDPEAEASMVSGSGKSKVAQAIVDQIDAELANIAAAKASGEISDSEFTKRQADLTGAKSRLQNPESFESLNLVNTASKNFGRQARVASVYHENIHSAGVEDEGLTEGITQKLMDNKLYGRNAATKGRHDVEIGALAKKLQDQGMGNDDILKQVDDEIKNRVNAEGKNRAERTINKETGKKESFSEAEAKNPGSSFGPAPEIDTTKIQEALDELGKRVTKTANSFKDLKIGSQQNSDAAFKDAAYAINVLNKSVNSNTAAFKKATGGQAPSSILEAGALKDILGEG